MHGYRSKGVLCYRACIPVNVVKVVKDNTLGFGISGAGILVIDRRCLTL